MSDVIQRIRTYLHLIETFQTDPALFEGVLHADFVQTELPNALNRAGQTSDRADLFRRMGLGMAMLTAQHYEVCTAFERGNPAVAEGLRTVSLANAAAPWQKGQSLTAHFCMVFDLANGLIVRQRNYDCFEAF